MTPRGAPAAIVLSGNELLDGRTRDVNGHFLAQQLSSLGLEVRSVLVVGDDRQRLEGTLRRALDDEPVVLLLSGGLGTTHDDLTAAALGRVLGVPLEEHPDALRMVEARAREVAERRGIAVADVLRLGRRQASLPRGARPLAPAGVAPGIATEHGGTAIYALPGVPWELRAMWPAVAEELVATGRVGATRSRTVRLYGLGETQVAPVLTERPHDLLQVTVNAGAGEVAVTVRYEDDREPRAQADALLAHLAERLPLFSRDGRTIDDILADALAHSGATVAVAESCTGGLLGARFTSRPGSSAYFSGGVIAYADAVKHGLLGVPHDLLAVHGAVSSQVAAAMCEGVRALAQATYGLSTTGIAGPDGGTAEKPVGLVFVGCAGPRRTRVERCRFPGERDAVREWTVARALHLLREEREDGPAVD